MMSVDQKLSVNANLRGYEIKHGNEIEYENLMNIRINKFYNNAAANFNFKVKLI